MNFRQVMMVLVATTGCSIQGSGVAAREDRVVQPFEAIEVRAGLEVDVTLGEQAVIVEGDDNIVPHVLTTVVHGRLRVEPEASFDPQLPLRITVSTPALVSAGLSAGGRLAVSGISGGELRLSVAAGGELTATGSVDRLEARLSAGGDLDAAGLTAGSVFVDGRAGGLITVHATDEIDGSVESGAEVIVYGRPARRDVSEASGGRIDYR